MRLSHAGLCLLVLGFGIEAHADQTAQKEFKILGKKVGVTQTLDVKEDNKADEISDSGVESKSTINLFGKKIEIVKNSVQYQVSEDQGLSYKNDFYVKGKKVLAQSLVDGDGRYAYNVDIPYTEVAGDVFSYSLGIVSLGVYSGLSYDGALQADVSSELLKKNPSLTADMNLARAEAGVDIMTKGFIEGQVRLLFVKGAVGGALNLIDGKAHASIAVNPLTIKKPEVTYGGSVHLLSGSLYGYVGSGSTRWFDVNFYKSKGHCVYFGDTKCAN